jgi:hypothetical protein
MSNIYSFSTKTSSSELLEDVSNSLENPKENMDLINNTSTIYDSKNNSNNNKDNLLYISNSEGNNNLNNLIVNRKKLNFNNYDYNNPDSPINKIFQTSFTEIGKSFKMNLDDEDIDNEPINSFEIFSFFNYY